MRHSSSFSLIELLVGLSVITIALLELYLVLASGMDMSLKNKRKAIAYHIASQEMEIIRNTAFSSLTNQTEGSFLGTVIDLDKLPGGIGRLTIENYQGSSEIKKVTIKVLWSEGASQREVKLTTLVSSGGLNQ